MSILLTILVYLSQIIFDVVIFILLLRIFLQIFKANNNNQISQFVAQYTNPIVNPLAKILPKMGLFDLSAIIIVFIVEILKFTTIGFIANNVIYPLLPMIIFALRDLILYVLNFFFYAIIIRVILSWFNPTLRNAITAILYTVTEPMLNLFKRFVPKTSTIDLSPFAALVLLQLLFLIISSVGISINAGGGV